LVAQASRTRSSASSEHLEIRGRKLDSHAVLAAAVFGEALEQREIIVEWNGLAR
jgi:hypothetical protein